MNMKNLLSVLALCSLLQTLSSQPCGNPQSQIDIHGNNIQARILNGGDLFTDLSSGQFLPNPDPNSFFNPSTIYAAGLWLGGMDLGGNLKLAAVDYRGSNRRDYSTGPLGPDGTTDGFNCANWDRHFRVTNAEVTGFLAALPLSAAELKSQFPGIAGWPAKGNPFFQDVWGFDLPFTNQNLAPFYDANFDGAYNPLDGDYPAAALNGFPWFVPKEMIWCVFNDQNGGSPHTTSGGAPLHAEIQLTVWAFDCPDQPVLNNTLFTSHKIIYKGTEPLDSVFAGIWADTDIGCSSDDYVGCNPALQTMYAYNTDAVDGNPGTTCQGTPTFPSAPPVQSITFLNQPLSKFISANNASIGNPPPGSTDPTQASEYYNYLSGSWKDGTPFTYGGSGYGGNVPTDHVFSSDPADPQGWSMCSENLSFSDRRMLGSTQFGAMQPGDVRELTAAWTFHPEPSLPCGLGTTFSDVETLHTIFDNKFAGVCGVLKAPELPQDSLDLFPNPTSSGAWLRYGKLKPQSVRIFDVAGRLLLEQTSGFPKEQVLLETALFDSGIYTLQIATDQGSVTKKLAVIH